MKTNILSLWTSRAGSLFILRLETGTERWFTAFCTASGISGAFNNVLRPGIVHRLDATTSGLMVVAREQKSLESLQEQFRQRTVLKKYLALVHGKIKQPSGRIDLPIGRSSANRLKMAVAVDGRHAVTKYRVLWRRKGTHFWNVP